MKTNDPIFLDPDNIVLFSKRFPTGDCASWIFGNNKHIKHLIADFRTLPNQYPCNISNAVDTMEDFIKHSPGTADDQCYLLYMYSKETHLVACSRQTFIAWYDQLDMENVEVHKQITFEQYMNYHKRVTSKE